MTEHTILTKIRHNLLPVDYATLIYALFTSLLLVVFWNQSDAPWKLLGTRVAISTGVVALTYLYILYPSRVTMLLRQAYPLAMLGVWYPDIFEFSRHLPNFDHVFAAADYRLFGCEPSLEMSKWFSGIVWSELFNAGYFSYYLMIVGAAVVPLLWNGKELLRTIFIVTVGFFAYYIVFIFLPVAGPQFYFAAIDPAVVADAQFPALGYYFDIHPDAPHIGNGIAGFFQYLVELMQESGERPVAAFPSSHVGMGTVIMILFWRLKRGVFWAMLPFYIQLCGATVYIGAHYFVDVIGGWLTAVLFYMAAKRLYDTFNNKNTIAWHYNAA